MTDAPPALSTLPRALTLGVSTTLGLCLACIPSFPPCNCTTEADAEFPDFERLDRSEPCIDGLPLPEGADDPEACGYPAGSYGFTQGEVFPNLELLDCEGNAVQLAEYLPQEGQPEVETRGVVFAVGALWCQPCQVEGIEWASEGGLVDEYESEGIQFIQALDQGASPTEPMSQTGCMGWSENVASGKFPILYVPEAGALQSQIQVMPAEPIPYTLVLDANANVRLRQTGEVLPESELAGVLDLILSDPYGD